MAVCAFLDVGLRLDLGFTEDLLYVENYYRKHICLLGNQRENNKRSSQAIFRQGLFIPCIKNETMTNTSIGSLLLELMLCSAWLDFLKEICFI